MKVTVRFYPSSETKEVELEAGATGMSLIESLNLNPDSYILARSGRPIPIDEELTEGETLTLISVVSGG
ncbi:MAG: MoaD/ThiS family protein [Thermoplasmata archaeon]